MQVKQETEGKSGFNYEFVHPLAATSLFIQGNDDNLTISVMDDNGIQTTILITPEMLTHESRLMLRLMGWCDLTVKPNENLVPST